MLFKILDGLLFRLKQEQKPKPTSEITSEYIPAQKQLEGEPKPSAETKKETSTPEPNQIQQKPKPPTVSEGGPRETKSDQEKQEEEPEPPKPKPTKSRPKIIYKTKNPYEANLLVITDNAEAFLKETPEDYPDIIILELIIFEGSEREEYEKEMKEIISKLKKKYKKLALIRLNLFTEYPYEIYLKYLEVKEYIMQERNLMDLDDTPSNTPRMGL